MLGADCCSLQRIYLFQCFRQGRLAWRDGSAVSYALHQDKLGDVLGVWLREQLGPSRAIPPLFTLVAARNEWLRVRVEAYSRFVRRLAACSPVSSFRPLATWALGRLGLNSAAFKPCHDLVLLHPLLLMARTGTRLSLFARRALADRLGGPSRGFVASFLHPRRRRSRRVRRRRWLSEGAVLLLLVGNSPARRSTTMRPVPQRCA